MEKFWQFWQLLVLWGTLVWEWVMRVWQGFASLPWGVWWNSLWIIVAQISIPNMTISMPNIVQLVTNSSINANSINVVSNIATILATLWLIINGREYFYQSRLDRLQELYVCIEELNRGFMSVNKGVDADLLALRTNMKNQFYNYQFILVRDPEQRQDLKILIERVDDDAEKFKVRKNFKNINELKLHVSTLIDARPWYSRLIYFVFVKMWRYVWRWFRGLFAPKTVG
jgi:hypothetical protein